MGRFATWLKPNKKSVSTIPSLLKDALDFLLFRIFTSTFNRSWQGFSGVYAHVILSDFYNNVVYFINIIWEYSFFLGSVINGSEVICDSKVWWLL